MDPKVSAVKFQGDLSAALREVLDLLGGIGRFVASGDKVLLKPNFNTADPFPASSDPAFIAAVADLCREAGATEVTVADSSTFYANTWQVMEKLGIQRLAEDRSWLQVVSLDDDGWTERPVPKGQYLKKVSLPTMLESFDKIIFLCCLKTHKYATYTGALKLAVGLMRPQERMNLHLFRLEEKIAELASAFQPHLTVMDARKCFISGGPMAGETREPNLILASTDRVALDVEGIKIIQSFPGNSLAGRDAEEMPQIRRARELGVDLETPI